MATLDDTSLRNSSGLGWVIKRIPSGYSLGEITLNSQRIEQPLRRGVISLRNLQSGEGRPLAALTCEQVSSTTALFSGQDQIEGVPFIFDVTLSLVDSIPAARLTFRWQVEREIEGWEVCLGYQDGFSYDWAAHLYPFAEDARFIAENPLTYVGVPSALFYRSDRSFGLLFGIDPQFDYLNPTSWTGQVGFHFMNRVTPPQFRIGGGKILPGIEYSMPLQLLLSDAEDMPGMVISLARDWIALNGYQVENLFVRLPDQALALFLEGRRTTTSWTPGVGYRLEVGDPHANFVYLGEQPLSAYFEYRIYALTADPLWRQRCFEQMDFLLSAQNDDPAHLHYGAFHTAYDLGKQTFDSDDRGFNIGYKPDLNAYMARYMLQTWQRVKELEGIDRQDWYQAAVRAADWVGRQCNPDGGLPQKVDLHMGHKSISAVSGRALPAMPVIAEITGDPRYRTFATSLEGYLMRYAEGHLRFTGHHPDLPPDEIEEASIWGAIEYWLDTYDRSGEGWCLQRALADAYLSFLWWCPKQLTWVRNPTQCASAEQRHFLQYSIYCYQNRKLQCLHRLGHYTGDPFFTALYQRLLQGILWTQVTSGDQCGATYERIADPWLARSDHDQPADFNSLGSIYMGEQSLDTMLQLVEMGEARV